jgi:hypothetical protein
VLSQSMCQDRQRQPKICMFPFLQVNPASLRLRRQL